LERDLAQTKAAAAPFSSGPASGNPGADASAEAVRALIETFLAGGDRAEDAFTRLVGLFRDRVLSIVTAMLGDTDPAEDVAQEVFLKVHANLSQFRFESRFDAWLCRIATRTAVDHTRRFWPRRRVALEGLSEPEREALLGGGGNAGAAGRPDDPESRILAAERARIVRRALREVPASFRAAVVLKDLAELSYEEIGRALGCPLGTVESRIHRGRAILRKKLEGILRP